MISTRQILLGLAGVALVLPSAFGRQDAGAASGITLAPSIIERTLAPGRVGQITVRNGLSRIVEVRVAARPWLQSRDGTVTPNRRRTLGNIKLSLKRFTMPPNSSRTVNVDLRSAPSARSLYGSVEFLATPRGQRKGQVKVTYRLISALRLNPPARRQVFRVQAGRVKKRSGLVLLAVRSSGNTAAPLTGTSRFSSASGGRANSLTPVRILPGYNVDVPVASTKGLPKGKYTATVQLRQGGKLVAIVKRQVSIGG